MLAAVQIRPEVLALKTTLGLTPAIGPFWVLAIDALFIELISFAASSATGGEFLARVSERISRLTDAEVGAAGQLREMILDISAMVIGNEYEDERWGLSHEIVDGHPDKRRGCMSAHSAEFFFNASSDNYLDFMDEILAVSKAQGVPGYASIRFTGKSDCLLAMERFKLTAAIEIAVLRRSTANGELFEAFTDIMHAKAKKFGGIPHWGQRHKLKAEDVESLYGGALEKWRYVLAEIELGHPASFSTEFSRKLDLEVLDSKIVDRMRTERDAGAFVSSLVPVYR